MEEKKTERNRNRIIIGSHARWFALTADLKRTEQATQRAKFPVRYAHNLNLGIARRAARVHTECAAHAVRPAFPRANVRPKLSAYSSRAATERISNKDRPSDECANVAINMATSRQTVPNQDVKHAAAYRTETLGASNAQSTSARNAKARSVQKGTIRGLTAERLNEES